MPPLRAWPQHDIEHELRSIRYFLRQFPECPDEVRINRGEGSFIRPSIVLRIVDASEATTGRHLIQKTRALSCTWYGADDESHARQMQSFLMRALARGEGARGGGVITIYDFSQAPSVQTDTDHGIEVAPGSVSGDLMPDIDNKWMVPVTLRYSVRLGEATLYQTGTPVDSPSPTTVTSITSVTRTTEIE